MRGICYYDIIAENKAINAAFYLQFLKGVMDRWHSDRKRLVWLLDDYTEPHDSASTAH